MFRSLFSRPTLLPGARLLGQTEQFSVQKVLKLNDLRHAEGAVKKRKRWGRGIGSGRGKNSGHGHQFSRSTPRAFEGGQTPLYKRLPKIGFKNANKKELEYVNLQKVQEFIDMGRLVPKPNTMITIRDLMTAGLISRPKEGVKLLAKGKEVLTTPLHLEVSSASEGAIAAVEKAGGTVTCVHFNALALRALVRPLKFELLPRRARPNPKRMQYYLDVNKAGYLSPEVQIRNLNLFGAVTSEKELRAEHDKYMDVRREEYRVMREARRAALAQDAAGSQ